MAMERQIPNSWIDDDGSGNVGTIWNKARVNDTIDCADGSLHGAQLSLVGSVAITAGWNLVPVATVDFNSGYVASAGTLVVPNGGGGLYLVVAQVTWAIDATNSLRALQIQAPGPAIGDVQGAASAQGNTLTLPTLRTLVAGNTLAIYAYQAIATTLLSARFGLVRL